MNNNALAPDPSEPTGNYDYSITVVGDPKWTDYAVDVDVSHKRIDSRFVRVLARAQNWGNYMAMEVGCCGTHLILVVNGNDQKIASSETRGIDWSDIDNWKTDHLRVEVRGSTYTLISNGMTLVTTQDSTFSSGKAGLAAWWRPDNDVRFDNFRVSPL